jgi:hypothetical protein
LEKVIDNHLAALKLFGGNSMRITPLRSFIENEQISLEIIDGMFIIEETEPNSQETKTIQAPAGLDNLKSIISSTSFLKLDSIDYQNLMNTEAPLLSRDTDVKIFFEFF